VTPSGRVELECAPCARGERAPAVAAIESEIVVEPVTVRRRRGWVGATLGLGAVALISLLGAKAGGPAGSAAAATSRPAGWDEAIVPVEPAEPSEESVEPSIDTVHLLGRPAAGLDLREPPPPPPIPERNGEPLDELLPTLLYWVHPVPGSPDIVPNRESRRFGSHRNMGSVRDECGGGHCGVDLEGERGQPVVAVAWGTVVRIQNDPDGRGGRYVKVEHPDFVYTSYFHLDRIARGLEVGMEVEPGTPLGTLGASGIHISMPHLHFALEVVERGELRFIDPVPFLHRAEVLDR